MGEDEMTEEQRAKLEQLIWKFEQVIAHEHGIRGDWHDPVGREHARSEVKKARDRITDHLDTIPNLLDKKGRLSRITERLMRKNRRGKFPPNKEE